MAQDLEQLVLTISADNRQMQRALAKLTGDVKSAGDGIDKAFKAPKVDDVAKSLNKTRFETANLAAQFQDIAVQLQGGQSPFTIALQQGTQISQVLGQRGATGVVGLLGSAFGSLLSPVSLATIGIIALGGAAVQYGAKAIGVVDDLDERVKRHAELVKSLKDAYGEAGKGIETASKESAAVTRALLSISTDRLQKDFEKIARSAAALGQQMYQFVDDFGRPLTEAVDKFAPFRKVIDDFNASVRAGKPDIKAFREAISDIVNNSPEKSIRELGGELLSASEKAGGLASNLAASKRTLEELAGVAKTINNQDFAEAMTKLSGTVTKNLTDREKIEKNFQEALKRSPRDDQQIAAMASRDQQLENLRYNERKKAAEDAARDVESSAKRFQSALNSIFKRNAMENAATPALAIGARALFAVVCRDV